ncbi:hypothetical protein QCA50_013162 [Cerrena zonata]|uniref:Phosphatidylserine decarboxylase n=1 Tax=Cerrena zonata TaxID=2478898 RepID=A0AAW0FSG9_9APHY
MSTSPTIVDTLREYLARPENEVFLQDFKQAFKDAKAYDIPQFEEYGIHTFDDYLAYLDTYLTWLPTENRDGKSVYYHICMFYFVIDQPPFSQYQTPIVPSGPWTWLSQWIIDYAREVGKFMDSEDSFSPAALKTFENAPSYRMQDYIEPPNGWKTFNEFFARHIKPDLRPIASPENDLVIVSPADSVFDGSWEVNESSFTSFKDVPWSISQLLEDTKFGERFKGGVFSHAFLAPNDYHRQHAPVRGKVLEARVIPGLCYLEVVVKEHEGRRPTLGMKRKLQHHPAHVAALKNADPSILDDLDAPDSPGYQFLQARGLIIIDNPTIGLVAVLPIGMAQVSSVVLSVKEGDVVVKGQEISYFQLGGSDCVMVFEKKANVDFTADLHVHYNFGQQVAKAQMKH